MDDRTRFVGLVLLGIMGLGAMVAITACALTNHEVPPSIIAVASGCLGAIIALVPPSTGGRLEELSSYARQANHKTNDNFHTLTMKMGVLDAKVEALSKQSGTTIVMPQQTKTEEGKS